MSETLDWNVQTIAGVVCSAETGQQGCGDVRARPPVALPDVSREGAGPSES